MHHLSTGRRDQLGWGQGRMVGGGEVESSRTALLAESFPSLPLPALAQLQAQEASPLGQAGSGGWKADGEGLRAAAVMS